MTTIQKQLWEQIQLASTNSDVRNQKLAVSLAEQAIKANSKLPSSIQIVLLMSLLNGLLEGYKIPLRITLVTV